MPNSDQKDKFNWKDGDVEIISVPKELTQEEYDERVAKEKEKSQ